MMVKPTVKELLNKVDDNRFRLVIATSKRARQIASGSEVLTEEDEESPVSLAADEIAEGKVTIVTENQTQEDNIEENKEEAEEEINQ